MTRGVRLIGFALLMAMAVARIGAQEIGPGRAIKNPYAARTQWRVWRDDESPLAGIQSLVREGKEKKVKAITLAPAEAAARRYPLDPAPEGRFLAYGPLPEPSEKYAGIWDDVYTSWSGLHGYVRNGWKGPGGDAGGVLNQIIHFVDVSKQNTFKAGVNFIHQSTTGMGHSIANGYLPQRTAQFEQAYFGDALITGPAHASFTEQHANRTSDLYMALFPTMFNSVGSSNSETMAITKMILAGGYLPPETKLTLKRNGLYPAAMLYIWKAALPYPVPYDHELRHRIAYRSVGDRTAYPERYGATALERGDLSHAYHRYDDEAHMRNMVAIAKSMTTPLPEAVLQIAKVDGGKRRFTLKKTLLVVQEKGETVRITVSTEDSYDLLDRPLTCRWKLLYGNRETTVTRIGDSPAYRITVPWDDKLPQGRTAIALIANNGAFDSNPAVINVYRRKGEIPGTGLGPGDYKYPDGPANRRPAVLGLMDVVAKPGETVQLTLDAVDLEGFPVLFTKRSGEVGELDGNVFEWKVPADAMPGAHPITIIASDGTSGNSYAGETVNIEVDPKVFAHITTDRLTGPAPLTVKVSAEGSFDKAGAAEFGWQFYAPSSKRKPTEWKDQTRGAEAVHKFDKPGHYEITLTVKGPSGIDTETVTVLATAGADPVKPAAVAVLGNDVSLRTGAKETSPFDHTNYGTVDGGQVAEHDFLILNAGDEPLAVRGVEIGGRDAREFAVVKEPREVISPRGSTVMRIRFAPVGPNERTALVTIRPEKGKAFTFAISGTSRLTAEALDAAAAPAFAAAKKLYDAKEWEAAGTALAEFVKLHPGSSQAEKAAGMIAKIESDPAIRKAIEAARAKEAAAADLAKQERQAKSIWAMAENFRKNGRADLAKKNLEKIVREFPETTWAEKARAALGR